MQRSFEILDFGTSAQVGQPLRVHSDVVQNGLDKRGRRNAVSVIWLDVDVIDADRVADLIHRHFVIVHVD